MERMELTAIRLPEMMYRVMLVKVLEQAQIEGVLMEASVAGGPAPIRQDLIDAIGRLRDTRLHASHITLYFQSDDDAVLFKMKYL